MRHYAPVGYFQQRLPEKFGFDLVWKEGESNGNRL